MNAGCPPSEIQGQEVVVLGDVFVVDPANELTRQLEANAREAGALEAEESYRDYSSRTQNALAVEGSLLLDRFSEARSENLVRVVVMNGGGSDLLLGSCEGEPTPDCQLMLDIVSGAETLLTTMSNGGVEQVVWFYYPEPSDETLRSELEVLEPLLRGMCESRTDVDCIWVGLKDAFQGHSADYLQSDFVPTVLGAEIAASIIWESMTNHCIAQ